LIQDDDLSKYLAEFRNKAGDRRSQAKKKRLTLRLAISFRIPEYVTEANLKGRSVPGCAGQDVWPLT
jgi:hypothetical protein